MNGLTKDNFTIHDDGVPQIINFFSDADAAVSLAVIFDTSGSMSGDKILRAREALGRFVETSHREDEYFLISFSERVRLVLDRTRDADALLDKFTYAKPRGSRARRAILLITDGLDTASRYSFKELRRSLQESDAVLYAIGILGPWRFEARQGRSVLKELAAISGGKAFFPDSADEISGAFDSIALELRHQYSLGYRPTDLADSSIWHRVKVAVASPNRKERLRARNRDGFYAFPNRR